MTNTPGLTYLPDAGRGEWIRGRLGDWSTIASVVPQGFEAYARIFHPVDAQLLAWHDDLPVTQEVRQFRWRDITAARGTIYHPLMQWTHLAGYQNPGRGESGWQCGGPDLGRLPVEELSTIVKILAEHTDTPGTCVASLWEGYGWIHGGGAVLTLTSHRRRRFFGREGRLTGRFRDRFRGRGTGTYATPASGAFPLEIRNGPRLELPFRSYFLFDTRLPYFQDEHWPERSGWDPEWPQTPNQLWPEDRAWFLASEIDFDSTIVAGSAALIADLVRCKDLEAMEIPAGASLTTSADTLNR